MERWIPWAVVKRADAPMPCTGASGLGEAYTAISRTKPHQPRMNPHTIHLRTWELLQLFAQYNYAAGAGAGKEIQGEARREKWALRGSSFYLDIGQVFPLLCL